MGDSQDRQDRKEGERDLFGEEDFDGSEEAKALPHVIARCHRSAVASCGPRPVPHAVQEWV